MRTSVKLRNIDGRRDTRSAHIVLGRGASALLMALVLSGPALPMGASWMRQDQQKQTAPPAPDAQQPQESSSKRPASAEPAQPTPPAKGAQPDYNPLDSEKDVEVGTFYMHKGDVDAAIPRFEDAIRLRANYAKPRLLLGEAYEKKHDHANAVKYYKEYLQVFPDAPDAKKVQNTIDRLSKK